MIRRAQSQRIWYGITEAATDHYSQVHQHHLQRQDYVIGMTWKDCLLGSRVDLNHSRRVARPEFRFRVPSLDEADFRHDRCRSSALGYRDICRAPASVVAEIRFIEGWNAETKFGPGHAAGVIQVYTRTQ